MAYKMLRNDSRIASKRPSTFRVHQFSSISNVLFDLHLTPWAMAALERHRNGQGVAMTLKLQAEIRTATELHFAHDDVYGNFNVGQWIVALEQTGYGNSLLFEVPLPRDLQGLPVIRERLESARQHHAQGHYSAYFRRSWTAFQADRGRDFSVIVDGVSV